MGGRGGKEKHRSGGKINWHGRITSCPKIVGGGKVGEERGKKRKALIPAS